MNGLPSRRDDRFLEAPKNSSGVAPNTAVTVRLEYLGTDGTLRFTGSVMRLGTFHPRAVVTVVVADRWGGHIKLDAKRGIARCLLAD